MGSFYQSFAHIMCYKIKSPKSNKKTFLFIYIVELIKNDWVTCARYYNHKTLSFQKIMTKDHFIFGFISFLMKFQNHGSEYDHGLLWIMHQLWSAHKWRNWMVQTYMYISCDLLLSPNSLQNAQQYQHMCICNNKNHMICKFHYPLLIVHETKVVKPLEMN